MYSFEHEKILSSSEYISLCKENNILIRRNRIKTLFIIVLVVFLVVFIFLFRNSQQDLKYVSSELDYSSALFSDEKTGYYSGYSDGQNDLRHEYNLKISEAKEKSYIDGYSTAMRELSENKSSDLYTKGYSNGITIGYDEGYFVGYEDACESEVGYDSGYEAGYADGYDDGYTDCSLGIE